MEETYKSHKKACSIPCSHAFKKKIDDLAKVHHVNPADIIRSILFVFPTQFIEAFDDPGEPTREDRENITLASGQHQGKVWKRKPRIQVRIPQIYPSPYLRKALNIALMLHKKGFPFLIRNEQEENKQTHLINTLQCQQEKLKKDIENLTKTVKILTSYQEKRSIRTIDDALFALAIPPHETPSPEIVKKRFRDLAILFHPDMGHNNYDMMTKLNEAMSFLRKSKYLP